MSLTGKTKEQIAKAVEGKTREELIELLYSLASLEPMFSPEEVASRRDMSKRSILRLVKRGVLKAHKPFQNGVRIPLSTIREWDLNTKL
jgi:excisionase family DNA binding protein